jgi:cyclophilin family peptidyl-prolyl cis-trans isomerase
MYRQTQVLVFLLSCLVVASSAKLGKRVGLRQLSKTRAVFQTDHGDIHLAFYPNAAPKTVELVLNLIEVGAYNTNHFFRVDKGFVAQVADVSTGRTQGLSNLQQKYASKTVPLEVHRTLKHDAPGILSLARSDDPHSGGSSFSILLGSAPHLDTKHTIFGEITSGYDVLESLQEVETVKEGIFVMPKERINIHSTYLYIDGAMEIPSHEALEICEKRLDTLVKTLKNIRNELQMSSSSSLSSEVSSF